MTTLFVFVSIVLTAVGSVTGFVFLANKWRRRAVASGERKVKKVLSAIHSDHMYRRLELGCRLAEGGRVWHVRRDATLVSKSAALNSVTMSTHIYDLDPGSFRERVEPDTIGHESVPAAHPHDMGCRLRFPHALKQDEEQKYVYIRDFAKTLPLKKSDLFTASTYTECEMLSVRVVFDGWTPSTVTYQVTNRSASDVALEEIHTPDPLTYEVRKDIPFPDKDLTYGFRWE